MTRMPKNLLFACTHNMIRSPMAEAMMKTRFGDRIGVDSCGITEGSPDGFTIAVMTEVSINIMQHQPKTFAALGDKTFDLIICFSEVSHSHAVEFARGHSSEVEYWPIYDSGLVSENREAKLRAYRAVRDEIAARLDARFSTGSPPSKHPENT